MKELSIELLFWVSAVLVAYVYVLYPALLWLLAKGFPRASKVDDRIHPKVTLLISAYNERSVIASKIENSLVLDYPPGNLEIVVVSDCSDDGTDEMVGSYAACGVRLIRQNQRLGKAAGLNLGVAQSTGDLVVFSDANAIYQPDAVLQLVRHFGDPSVGYAVGNAKYSETAVRTASAESEGSYWKMETWLKQLESQFGSVVGGDGAIYAIRRELFLPLLATDINDFLNPLQIVARGYWGVYEPAAVCFEEAGESFQKEFRRKVRIISRGLNAIRREPRVVLPWVQPRHWLALISHKILRWFAPLFLILLVLSSGLLSNSRSYFVALWLQVIFYALALTGSLLEKRNSIPKYFYLPYYFCVVNAASLLGIFRFLTGTLSPTWETIRSAAPSAKADDHLVSKGS
jgi:cellulose synthase/poly-beta-1,6-N-acetylglucosamine synthase-like glycosyltransferase